MKTLLAVALATLARPLGPSRGSNETETDQMTGSNVRYALLSSAFHQH
jgi:hypothetical protein